ncbi:MAG TPA: hypothetical protein DHW82_12650 [Spirochaetia bacterium]|nr:hypothetical protein [Spirochaetia bacterium]
MPSDIQAGNLFSDKIDAEGAIKKLIELEKSKADKWENEKFILEMKKKAWEGLQKKLKEVDVALKNLYNPVHSPFRKMKTKSENEDVITATAENKAMPGDYKVKVKKMASGDIFRTDVIERNRKMSEMKFEILYNGKNYKGNFRGGSLDAFSAFLNQNFSKILTSSIIKVDSSNVILHIEGKETGSEKNMSFKGELKELEKIGLLSEYTYADFNLEITKPLGLGANRPFSEIIKDDALYLSPGDRVDKLLASPTKGGEKIFLSFQMKIKAYEPPETIYNKMQNIPIGTMDKIWVGNIDIEGEPLLVDPDFGFQKKLENINNKYILTLNYKQQEETLEFPFNIADQEWQEIKIELKPDELNRVTLENPFKEKEIYIKDMKIADEAKKGFLAKNYLMKASDAILEYKGVEITRSENKISDVIPGVSLYLKGLSDKDVNLNLDWNYDEIKKQIFEFIVLYNNAMDFIKNITKTVAPKNQKQTKEWRESFKDITGKEAEEKAQDGTLFTGILNGDNTITILQTKIRGVIMQPFETSAGSLIRFITQLGITNAKYESGGSTQEDRENLSAGYLEFSEERFEKVLKDNYIAVQEYFFRDRNGDVIYDEGLAVKMSDVLKMVASDSFRGDDARAYPGLIKSRITMLTDAIKMKTQEIQKWAKHVEEYEQQLKSQFAQMYKAMEKSKSDQNRFKNFGNQGN